MSSGGKGGGGGGISDIDPNEVIRSQAAANRITQLTPQGNQIFGTIDAQGNFVPNTGDQSGLLIEESPFQQRFRQGFEDLALTLQESAAPRIQNLPLTPIDTSGLPALRGELDFTGLSELPQSSDFADLAQQAEQATFDRAAGLLNSQFDRQRDTLQQELANRGAPEGGELFNDRLGLLQESQNEALTRAALDSVLAGRQEQQRLFGNALASRGQGLNERLAEISTANTGRAQGLQEQQSLRATELGELANILGLQPVNPVGVQNFFPPAGIDVTGAFGLSQNADIARANAASQAQNSLLSGLFGLGSAGIGLF
ncbi:MAG: hypothetical protein QNJ62_05195 [Methyloceanibacter sp.]|nr:hypothetical protein [Methyloceanibacter sp.]